MKTSAPLSVLVVGAGLYVCGRGTDGYGTILPTLYQAKKEGIVGEVSIAATNPRSIAPVEEKVRRLDTLFGFPLKPDLYPKGKKEDLLAYQKILQGSRRPDCAVVSIPDHLHFPITVDLIQKDLHCLVVKPLAPTVSEVQELTRLAEEAGIYGAVEFHKRYDRSNLKLRDAIRQGMVGDPLYFIVEYSQRKNVPLTLFKKWVGHTNIFQYLGIHYVDIIYFATGAFPRRVMALGIKNLLRRRGVNTFDAVQCLIEWEMPNRSRFTSAILTNWVDPQKTSAMSYQRIKVIGTKGRYEADQKYRGISLVTDAGGIEEPNPDFSSFYGTGLREEISFQGYGPESILRFLKDVAEIRGKRMKPEDLEGRRPTFRESLIPTAVLEAANQSLAAEGRWVDIDIPTDREIAAK